MAGFRSVGAFADAFEEGRVHTCSIRKVPSQASSANWWIDLSMASGNPKPQYFFATPFTAQVLDGYDGIFHGADKAPASMHLASLGLMTPTAAMVGRYTLLDYLIYYTGIDGDDTATQVLSNSTPLPRYVDGAGVQVMAVLIAPSTGGGVFTFDYVNQDGVTQTSPAQVCGLAASNIATLATAQPAIVAMPGGPFLKLAPGDTGVRQVNSVTFSVANGGLLAIVLVKPLADLAIREINTAAEFAGVRNRPLPKIEDGAYLNMICAPAGSVAAGLLSGYATFVWST